MIGRFHFLLRENGTSPLSLGFFLTTGSAPRGADVQISIASVKKGTQPHSLEYFTKLPLIWMERAAFRAKLRADLKDDPDLLHDIGIGLHGARAEVTRFFWEPVVLTQR